MNITCDEDKQQLAVAYCTCKYPLPALCEEHAIKHLESNNGSFHFALPISASDVITSEEIYMQVKPWLVQLNDNYDLLQKKVELLSNGEEEIEAVYQDLLHFLLEEKDRLKQMFSTKKEEFRTEVELAISKTRFHALERYEPEHVLAQLIWDKSPPDLVSSQLFSFQAKFIPENLPSVFQVGLIFLPGLDHLDMGKCVPPQTAEIETLKQRLFYKEESVQMLSQHLEDAKTQETRSKNELEEVTRKLQDRDNQLQFLSTYNQELLQHIENIENSKTYLEIEARELKEKLQEAETLCSQLMEVQTQIEEKNSVLERKINNWRITNDHPMESQDPVPDSTTPQSRAALAKFGPYDFPDSELVLLQLGPVEFDDGVYIGQWNTRNLRHGYGKFWYSNGNLYEGQWRNGKKVGHGRLISRDGIVYIGEFVQDEKQGRGTIFFPNGDEHSGTWVHGKLEGFGSLKFGATSQWAGDQYIGEFSEGVRSGHGVYFWRNGNVYAGDWRHGKYHGKGVETYADGQIYLGDWSDGMRSGTGSLILPNGDVYRGRWQQGQKWGQGCLTHPGRVEEGNWVADDLHR